MNILHWIKLLSDLSENDKDNLSLFCQEKSLKKWEILFKEGDEANAMYILKSWTFEIRKKINWKEVILWNVMAEELLWEMALFWDTNKRVATAISLEDSNLVTILSFSIKDLAKKYPLLLNKIKDIINDRIIDNKIVETSIK